MWMVTATSSIFFASLLKYSMTKKQSLSAFYNYLMMLPRDLFFIKTLLWWNIQLLYRKLFKLSIIDDFRWHLNATPFRNAIIGFNGTTFTFQQLENFSNRVSNFIISNGHSKEKVIVLIMENCPEYVGLWLGIAKCGIITALQNYNLTGEQLLHCLKCSEAKTIIVSSKFYLSLKELDLSGFTVYIYDPHQNINNKEIYDETLINLKIEQQSIKPIEYSSKTGLIKPSFEDILFYIFTSGTTGLPKPVRVSYRKAYTFASSGAFLQTSPSDVIYTFLPLYHINSGIVNIMQCFFFGASIVIRDKFSATNFAKDCVEYNITGFNYVGEVCRYLMNIPIQKAEKNLKLRYAFGNGLRENIWNDFMARYKINLIGEFYGSTEGNVAFINFTNKAGACGFLPIWAYFALPYCIVKCDLATGEIYKDENGHCVECTYNEPGHIIGRISPFLSISKVDGYTNKEATKAKLIHNAFVDGDLYFMTGDIMRQDEFGFYFFVDRIGDTFRWKGENVSTLELENLIIKRLSNKDVVVYGVEIPGNEGKAGMLTLVDEDNKISINTISEAVYSLPSYQRPVFLRISSTPHITTTFKFMKTQLKKDGFSLKSTTDPLYYYNNSMREYQPLTQEIYDQIISGVLLL